MSGKINKNIKVKRYCKNDQERKKKNRKELKVMKENEKCCSTKFKSILSKYESKYQEMVEENTKLEEELVQVESKHSELTRLVNEQETEVSWKSKYKKLFAEHELCKKPAVKL
jgi:hypothetical protein